MDAAYLGRPNAQRIAVVNLTAPGWTAGRMFTEILVRSLRGAAGDEADIRLLGDEDGAWHDLARAVPLEPIRPLPGEVRLRRRLNMRPARSAVERYCDTHGVTALLQMIPETMRPGRMKYRRITWLPDFQHLHYPDLFSDADRFWRNAAYAQAAQRSDAVLLTSRAVYDDYQTFAPRYARKAHVIAFPSLYAYTPPRGELAIQPAQYGLPDKFILVANQFWAHKGHATVVEAVAILRRRGIRIPVALTGQPSDYREPSNATVSTVLQRIALQGLAGQVIPLGMVPRDHLTSLLRCAAIVIQPSRFEGWSALVHDATALARPLICSEIPVHREKAPHALGFFPPGDAEALAAILEHTWTSSIPGPDPAAERAGLEAQHALARTSGVELLALMG